MHTIYDVQMKQSRRAIHEICIIYTRPIMHTPAPYVIGARLISPSVYTPVPHTPVLHTPIAPKVSRTPADREKHINGDIDTPNVCSRNTMECAGTHLYQEDGTSMLDPSSASSPDPEPRRARTMLDFALYYVNKGLRVLPLHSVRSPDGCTCGQANCSSVAKHPITRNGVKDASCDAVQIREWWRLYPDANIGIATGEGLLVIDIDPRHGGSLEALQAVVALPATATVQTGSGGLHLYFQYDKKLALRNTAGKLAPGIDTRADNGYVVAAPSRHANGNRYSWKDRRPGYVQAPDALLKLLVEKPARQVVFKPVSMSVLLADNAAQPAQPAQPSRSPFVSEGRRNSTLVSLAGSLRNLGANEEALFIVLQAMNQACCRPPLSEAEVRQICTSAGRWEPGAESTRPSGLDGLKDAFTLLQQELPEPQWAVPGLLPEGVTLLAGKPKMGKSWLALNLAVAITQGSPALGRLPTQQGQVLYLGLEDHERRIADRLRKVLQDEPAPVDLCWGGYWTPLTDGGLQDLETYMTAVPATRLIIIDTLARVRPPTASGGSIYSEDYAIITPLKQFAEAHHLSVLLIHHLRKNGASDPMDEISGSTGLTGATDCNMVLQRERGQREATLHITGRDVEEQTLHLTFDEDCATWSLLANPTATPKLSPDRQAILDLLESMDRPMSPSEISAMLSMDYEKVRKKLFLMNKAELIYSTGRGLYQPCERMSGPDMVQRSFDLSGLE